MDAELANYSSKPINNPVYAGFTSYDEVAYNLERLRAKVDMRKEYQRALIHESMRQHEFMVQVVSSTESVFSIALPANELVG
ncbi:hypothetical protein BE04_06750 [Sorangium cellulosum]|uniref:Uncharacterized protein n=1 Tax=Sorangium cellulosum TaxID=56 RepID=A0A150PJT1_SORCE|nr:hypothetical protein BE04_06750 [Sorangium cellulosum]